MSIYPLGELSPKIDPDSWIAPNATVIGEVEIAKGASIWWSCTLRGDTDLLSVGENSNIQDNSVLHTDAGIELVIGENVTVGHQCMLHGCSIGDGSLIGIGAIVLNRARIGRHCVVGAGALVTEGKEFPDYAMILGSPAKAVRQLSPEEIEGLRRSAKHYVDNAKRFAKGLKRI